MVAGRERHFSESLIGLPKGFGVRVLPIAAVYGGNASGKSSFIAALGALQRAVVDGRLTQIDPFRLDKEQASMPTSFAIDYVQDGVLWHYELKATAQAVYYEELASDTGRGQKTVFRRIPGKECELNEEILREWDSADYARAISTSLPAHEVLLYQLANLQVKALQHYTEPAYEWFRKTLCIIAADGSRIGLGVDLFASREAYSRALSMADTGVEDLDFVKLNPDEVCPRELIEQFAGSGAAVSAVPGKNDCVLVRLPQGGVGAMRCISRHIMEDGSVAAFPFDMESDGTRRFMHLLPILLDRSMSRVYVVDELDRSLHTNLTARLIKQVRGSVAEDVSRRMQLIFSTHDVMLMTPEVLRKDEIWVTSRLEDHTCILHSFAEFKDIYKDRNYRSSYIAGRMGGVPSCISL